MVGLTTGLALKGLGYDVTLFEQAPELRTAGASIGIWENALQVFDECGVGEQVRDTAVPIRTWFYDAAGNRFRDPGYGDAEHSFSLLSRRVLNQLLADSLNTKNIRFGERISGYAEGDKNVTLRFESGSTTEVDMLIGADGVFSAVRRELLPAFPAQKHAGHHVWRATIPSQGEPAEGSVLTVGRNRTRGGFTRTYGGQVTWMVNQFGSPEPTGNNKDEALRRAADMNENGWGEPLERLIAATSEDSILHNQVMLVPELPKWVSERVALIGDAAHGLSPHISAGGTLGIEDVRVLARCLERWPTTQGALSAYEKNRIPHYRIVHTLADAVERSRDARQYGHHQAVFANWMLNAGAAESRI